MKHASFFQWWFSIPGRITTVAAVWLVVLSFACTQNPVIDEHPEFVHAVYTRADTAQARYVDGLISFTDSAFKVLSNPGIGDVYVKDSIKQSKYCIVKHDYLQALALLDTMMALVKDRTREEKYAQRYASALFEKGECFLNMKRYNESLHYITLAEEAVLTLVKNKCDLAQYSAKKAYLMFAQEKYLQSAAYFKTDYQQSLLVCNPRNYRQLINLQRGLNNIGLSYLKAGVLDSAAVYQQAALEIIAANEASYPQHKYDILNAKAVIYGDQAEVLSLRGKYHEAEALYEKSIAGTSNIDIGYTQSTCARLAELYLKDNKPGLAQKVLDRLKTSLDSLSNQKQLISWYKLTIKYYSQVNEIAAAFRYQHQYDVLRDSVEADNKKFITVDIAKSFENLELRYSNDVLQKESKLKTVYLATALLVFIAVAAIAIFVWYNLKRTRKLHREVAQKNSDLQLALTSLEQSHEENNRIIRIVAHDLKSPISAINNLIFSILRKDYPDDLKEILGLIKNACGNSMVLINDVLNKKKDPASIRKELVDMKKMMAYCVDLLQAKASEKNQHLNLDAEDVLLMLNRQKMWRVISNIVNNAIKFSPANAVINIRLQKKDESVLLSVHDNGIGIPAALKEKIFTVSPEVSRAGTFGEESYGMGLSISRKLVEEHEGKIWFESDDGKGAVFYIELPCQN